MGPTAPGLGPKQLPSVEAVNNNGGFEKMVQDIGAFVHTHEILSSDPSAYVKSQVCHMSLEPQCWWGGCWVKVEDCWGCWQSAWLRDH